MHKVHLLCWCHMTESAKYTQKSVETFCLVQDTTKLIGRSSIVTQTRRSSSRARCKKFWKDQVNLSTITTDHVFHRQPLQSRQEKWRNRDHYSNSLECVQWNVSGVFFHFISWLKDYLLHTATCSSLSPSVLQFPKWFAPLNWRSLSSKSRTTILSEQTRCPEDTHWTRIFEEKIFLSY